MGSQRQDAVVEIWGLTVSGMLRDSLQLKRLGSRLLEFIEVAGILSTLREEWFPAPIRSAMRHLTFSPFNRSSSTYNEIDNHHLRYRLHLRVYSCPSHREQLEEGQQHKLSHRCGGPAVRLDLGEPRSCLLVSIP